MNLTIIGSTGGTGTQIVHRALDSGHVVTAVARDPSRFVISHQRLRVLQADVWDPGTLDAPLEGADAVISALGTQDLHKPTNVYSAGVVNILDAMARTGVRRFIGISATPVTPRSEIGPIERFVIHPLLHRFFGEAYADMTRMEQILRASDADWTVVRPPRLTDGPSTGRYRTAIDRHLSRSRTISRADLAGAILGLLDRPEAVRATVDVAY